MKVELAISLYFLFPLYKCLWGFALFSNLIVPTFEVLPLENNSQSK